ncbi:hypothetical protein NPIL_369811 [Nephila pilipes]|uniref:Uncharacterized protein n=1 Tax=Nephila pilipes TaxID=299642 RepID=A0A8X6ULX8_NEPPI|nr:hypothetical protein NPIL_369811 [Nephila pilipes]
MLAALPFAAYAKRTLQRASAAATLCRASAHANTHYAALQNRAFAASSAVKPCLGLRQPQAAWPYIAFFAARIEDTSGRTRRCARAESQMTRFRLLEGFPGSTD